MMASCGLFKRPAIRLLLAVCFVAQFSSSVSVPFNGIQLSGREQQQQCSQTCNQLNGLIEYQTGYTYSYQVKLDTKIDTDGQQTQQPEQVQIRAMADVSVYAPCEMVLRLRNVELTGIAKAQQLARELEQETLHFAYDDGQVVDVCASLNERTWALNVKKSIISTLQMSAGDLSEKKTLIESDISGQCETIYEPVENYRNTIVLRKSKQLNKCAQRHQFHTSFFPRSYGLNQVLRSALPMAGASYECTQKISDKVITETRCVDQQKMWPLDMQVQSAITCQLVDQQRTLSVPRIESQFTKHRLTMSHEYQRRNNEIGEPHHYSVHDVEQLLGQMCHNVIDSVHIDVPQQFGELVRAFQSPLTVAEHQQLYESVRSGQFCQSGKLLDLFFDASALAGTEGAVQVLTHAYQQNQISQSRASYLFSLLSFAKSPSVQAGQQLVQFLQQQTQQTLPRGIVLGITGFVHNLRVYAGQQQQYQVVDQLVYQLQQYLVQQVEQFAQQPEQSIHALTYVYALKNVGVYGSHQQQLVQRLTKFLDQYRGQAYTNEVRVGLVRALVDGADDQVRHYLFTQVFQDEQQSVELRAEAYRSILYSGTTRQQLEQIRAYLKQVEHSETGAQLANYVRSHQANLRQSSDVNKQTILPVDAPVFEPPQVQPIGITRNYEFSYLNQGLGVGVTVESDVVYEPQTSGQDYVLLPESVSLNLTVPVVGHELQLVEIHLHQEGLEPVVREQIRKISRSSKMTTWKAVKEIVDILVTRGNEIFTSNPQVRVLLQVALDGKTVLLVNEQDFFGESQQSSLMKEIFETLHKRLSIDEAFAITPVDFVGQVSTVNGLPVQMRVNSSAVFGLKTELNLDARDLSNSVVQFVVLPSFASQTEVAVEFYTGSERRSVEYVNRFYTAPQVNFSAQIVQGRAVHFKVNVPQSKYVFARVEQQVYTRNVNGERVRRDTTRSPMDRSYHVCSDVTRRMLGVVVCYDLSYQNDRARHYAEFAAEVSLQKVDQQLTTYELQAEIPYSLEQIFANKRSLHELERIDNAPFKFVFNTPGSQIDRETVFELELPKKNSHEQKQQARLRIQTPWKRILAQAYIRNDKKEKMINVECSVDEKKYMQMEIGVETLMRDEKIEYRPRMIVSMGNKFEPIHLTGVVSYSKGKKSIIFIELNDVKKDKQYVKATLVKVGRISEKSFLASADCMINIFELNGKVAGTFERSDRVIKMIAKSEYVHPKTGKRETANVALKCQNLSSGKMWKIENHGSIQLSQYPKYNVQYDHNIVIGSKEYFEHDLKCGWNNEPEQLRLYQLIKLTGQRGKYDIESNSIAVYKPKNIHYELQGTCALVGFGINGQKRYSLILNGKSRDQSENDFRGELSYSHLSKSPLKMKMRAAVKSASVDFVYSDEIEEKTPNNYEGHMLVQLTPEKQYTANYQYDMSKGNQKEHHHELKVELVDQKSRSTIRHHGMLKLSPTQLFVQSKLSADEEPILDGELSYNKHSASYGKFNHYGSNSMAHIELDPHSSPRAYQWSIQKRDLKHETSLQYEPKSMLDIRSKTRRDNDNILSFATKISPEQLSHVSIKSKRFAGDLNYNVINPNEKKASIKFEIPESYSHDSDLILRPREEKITLKSSTKHQEKNLLDIDAQYHPSNEHYIRVVSPIARTNFHAEGSEHESPMKKASWDWEAGKYSHQGSYHYQPESMRFDTRTMKDRKNLADLRYKWEKNVHNLEFDSEDLLKAKAECDLKSRKPYAKIDCTLQGRDGQVYEHQTSVLGERDLNTFGIDSTTRRQGEEIAQIKAHIDREGKEKSHAIMEFGKEIKSKIEFTPFKSGRVEVRSPKYDHWTEFNYEPVESRGFFGGENKKNNWKLASLTEDKLSQKKNKYNFLAQHDADKRTHFLVDIPQLDTEYIYSHPEENMDAHRMSYTLNSRTLNPRFKHSTEATYHMSNNPKPFVEVKSHTTRPNGDTILEVKGIYRHHEEPSELDVVYKKLFGGNLIASLYNKDKKEIAFSGLMKDLEGNQYHHLTNLEYKPKVFRIESYTDKSGKNIAQLKSYLTTDLDKKSFLTLKGANDLSAQLEVEPRIRRALIDFHIQPFEHQTHFFEDKTDGGYKLTTSTLKNKESLFDLDTAINRPTSRSHLKLKACPGGCFESQLEVHPENRFGKLTFNSDSIKHHSMFEMKDNEQSRMSGKKVHFKSATDYMNKPVFNLDARMHGMRGANEIDWQVPQFSLKSNVDMQNKEAAFDYIHRRSGRHVLGSVAVNQDVDSDRSFHADFAWDVDRNPNSKVVIEVNGKRLAAREANSLSGVAGEVLIVLQAEYAQNKFVVRQQFVPTNTFYYPIKSSIAFVAPNVYDSWELVYSHQRPSDYSYECKLYFLNQQQVKYGLEVSSQIQQDKFTFITNMICQNDPSLQQTYKVFGVQRAPGKYHLEASAVRAYTQKYELVMDVDHEYEQQISGKVELRIPNQEASFTNFNLDFVNQKMLLEIVNEKQQKQLLVQGQMSEEEMEFTAVAQFSYYPVVECRFKYIPYRHLMAKVDLDGETKLLTTYKYTGSFYGPKFDILAEMQSTYMPNFELECEGKQTEQGYYITVIGKQDANEILRGSFKRTIEGDNYGFTVEGWINRANGVELAKALLKSSYNAEMIRYNLEFEPNQNEITVVEPLYMTVTGRQQQEGGLSVVAVKITRGHTQDLIDADCVVKIGENRYYVFGMPVPERVEATAQYAPTQTRLTFRYSLNEQLQVESGERSRFERLAGQRLVSKIRNQLVAGIDEQVGGFEIVSTRYGKSNRRESVEHDLKVYSPASDRVLEYICAHEFGPESYYIKGQFKSDIRQREPVYSYVAQLEREQQAYVAKVEYHSIYFTSPKSVNVVYQLPTQQRPYDITAQIQLGKQQSDALTVEAYLEQKPAGSYFRQGHNSTVHFALRSADNQINLGLDGHVSDSSFGVVMHNVDRRGVNQQVYYLFHLRENNRFEVEIAHPTVRYFVNGQYRNKETTNDLLVDCIVNRYVQKRRTSFVLDQEYKVHVETQGKCVRADIEDTQNEQVYHQVNACVDTDRANIVNIAVDSVKNGEKTTDLNVRLDTRSVMNILKLYMKWNPQYTRQILSTLLHLHRQPSSIVDYEFVHEIAHKLNLLASKLYDSQYGQLMVQELQPIFDELNINYEQIYEQFRYYLTEPVGEMVEQMYEVLYQIYEPLCRVYQTNYGKVVRFFYSNPICRRVMSVLSNFDSMDKVAEEVARRVVNVLQHTHRMVVTSSSGRFIRRLMPEVPQAFHQLFNTLVELFGESIKYTTTYQELAHHLNQIAQQLFRYSDYKSIDVNRVQRAVTEVVKALLMPFNYKSTTRVLVFDPQQGELQVEIYNLAAHRRLFNDLTGPRTSKPNQTGFLPRYFYNHDDTIRGY